MSLRGLFASFVLLAAAQVSLAEDWPQFRGVNCSGISTATNPLPTTFSNKENVKWSAELGDGIGSPVVAAGRVFISAMEDENKTIALFAFDATTGKQHWKRTWPAGELPEIHKSNSHASTTAAADSERVYFYFTTIGMVACDAATGADRWQTMLPIPYYVFKWGAGMSPVLHGDTLVFVQDDDLSPAVYAFDTATGKIRWQDDRNDFCASYSHPVFNKAEDGDEVILGGTGRIVGYDLKTGKRKWHAQVLLRNIKTTPVCLDGIVYISIQSGGIANQWIASIDQAETGNRDGKVTRDELQKFIGKTPVPEKFYKKTFERGDANGDGALEGRELDAAFLPQGNEAGARFDAKEAADEYVLAVRAGGKGDVTDTHLLWKHKTKHTDHIVSPLISGGRMLLVKTGGIATCFDTEKGEAVWSPKRINNASGYFASPVIGDGKIYVCGDNGVVVVLKDGPELDVLATNDMGSAILATPAIADGRLFIRTRSGLFCLDQ